MTNIRKCEREFSGRMLLFWWVVTSVAGWTIGWGIADVIGDMLIETIGWSFIGVVGMLVESLVGSFVGIAQWLELRKYIRRAYWWIPVCSLSWVLGDVLGTLTWGMPGELIWHSSSAFGVLMGALVGFKLWRRWRKRVVQSLRIVAGSLLVWFCAMLVGFFVGPIISKFIIYLDDVVYGAGGTGAIGVALVGTLGWGVFGLVVGVSQWLVLRRCSRRAEWWVVANVVAWIAGVMSGKVGDSFLLLHASLPKSIGIIMSWVQVSFVYSSITGIVLVWVLRSRA